jgi:tRNA pseudouridine55 synthase
VRQSSGQSGILLVDKPAGLTSHDVVARTRKRAGTRKVGHAGTLDPMATGLLLLGLNSSTRLLTYLVGLDKEYFATVRLGQSTTTDDAEGEALQTATAETMTAIDDAAIRTGLRALSGVISQVPSSVSAIKVDGRRAYTLVRAGETVELAARTVTVSEIELLDSRAVDGFVDLDVRVECSSGTYIRAIARDLGESLGSGGHLTALRRTKIGPFSVSDAAELETLDVAASMLGPAEVASRLFPVYELSVEEAVDLGHGKRLAADRPAEGDGPVAAVAPDGRLVGLVEFSGGVARPLVNFPTDEEFT